MYHLFFLSLLSFLLFWNEGHSATASLTLSSSTKKEKPPLPPKSPIVERKAALLTKDAKKKKLLSNPISFTGAQWAHNQGIEGQGQTAVVMEYDIPKAVIGLGQITVIQHGLSHTKPGEKNHADAVIDSLLLVAPEARVVLIDGSFDLPDYLSLTKGQLSQIEKSHVISRSLGFNEDHLLTIRDRLLPKGGTIEDIIKEIKKRNNTDFKDIKRLLEAGEPKLLVSAAGNDPISLSDSVMSMGADVLNVGIKQLSEDPYMYKHLIIACAIGQRFTNTSWSAYPGKDKNLQEASLYTLGEDLNLLGAPGELIEGTSFSAPIISGAILLLKQKFPTLTIFQIKESLLESADRTFVVEDKDHLKKVTFVYESDAEKPNLSPFKDKKNRGRRRFNPELYGKGILNLRSAFLYAELKIRSLKLKGPQLTSTQLRTKMKSILKKRQNASATKIQAAFRGYQVRKRKLKAVQKG